MAEATGKKITQQATRQECWQQIGKDAYHKLGYKQALEVLQQFSSAEAREYLLKGITAALEVDNITKEDAFLALRVPTQEVASMEHVMQMHAIHQLFFEDLPAEKQQRYNRTLNLQWAIDIKEQVQN